VQLWPTLVRGRGIDAVWKTTGAAKPYAIIEAKASYDPTKSLKALLGEAGDKTEGQGGNSAGFAAAFRQRRAEASGPGTIRQTNGKVTQMGHGWIQNTKRLGPHWELLRRSAIFVTEAKGSTADMSSSSLSRRLLHMPRR
jgi:hypothetical protein